MSKTGHIVPPGWNARVMDEAGILEHEQHWKNAIAAARPFIFEATNVCEYFYNGTDQEYWKPDVDFPCMAPPALMTWIEYGRPTGCKTTRPGGQESFRRENLPPKTGILFMAVERENEYFLPNNDKYRNKPSRWQGETRPLRDIDAARMCLIGQVFMGMEEERLTIGPVGEVLLWLDDNYDCYEYLMFTPVVHESVSPFLEGQMTGLDNLIFPAMLTLTMLNLNNVSTETVNPNEGKKRKKLDLYLKHHGVPKTVYKTLLITPYERMGKQESTRAGSREVLVRRSTVYRGHVMRSGVDGRKHLFGNPKIVGRFWVPPGRRKGVGEVVKTYKVKVPNE